MFKKYFFVLLILIVLVSYGQILNLYVWQDDNAIFVKLSNLGQNAGFLGEGPFGDGVYRFTATPYIPLDIIFGHSPMAFYSLALLLYILTTICIYLVYSKIIGSLGGKIAGSLYAAGFIAMDGFLRLYNTVTTSFTIILATLIFYSYWQYYQNSKIKWYLWSILFYFLAVEFGPSRTHYLISLVILFEIIFLSFKKPLQSILFSFIRLVPFVVIFYKMFVQGADSRSAQVSNLFISFFQGEYYQSYGLISSLANIFIPDWLSNYLFLMENAARKIFIFSAYPLIDAAIVLILMAVYFSVKNKKVFLMVSVSLIYWRIIAGKIISTPILSLSHDQYILYISGGLIIILLTFIGIIIKDIEKKKIFWFFYLWMLINIAAYSAYMPTVSYESINRYLAHSFAPMVGILALLVVIIKNRILKKLILCFILIWGLGNLISSFNYQHDFILTRANPAREFHKQLKEYLPEIKKGDLLYFDIGASGKQQFEDAITVSQMPDTASLSWRYGIDRYAFQRFLNFDDLINSYKAGDSIEQIHSYFYDKNTFIDTTSELRKKLTASGITTQKLPVSKLSFLPSSKTSEQGTAIELQELEVKFITPLSSVTSSDFELSLSAETILSNTLKYPLVYSDNFDDLKKQVNINVNSAVAYQQFKTQIQSQMKISSDSDWQGKIAQNLKDDDVSTVWQSDRVLWRNHQADLVLDLGQDMDIDRIVWINGFPNNTPSEITVSASSNGHDWKTIQKATIDHKIENKNPQEIKFETIKTRYLKVLITKTILGDSPTIAEIWPVPANFHALDITSTESFISHPYSFISNAEMQQQVLAALSDRVSMQIYWFTNKTNSWQTTEKSKILVDYDGSLRQYLFRIPAGGTQLEAIKLVPNIPGNFEIESLSVGYPNLDKLKQDEK